MITLQYSIMHYNTLYVLRAPHYSCYESQFDKPGDQDHKGRLDRSGQWCAPYLAKLLYNWVVRIDYLIIYVRYLLSRVRFSFDVYYL